MDSDFPVAQPAYLEPTHNGIAQPAVDTRLLAGVRPKTDAPVQRKKWKRRKPDRIVPMDEAQQRRAQDNGWKP